MDFIQVVQTRIKDLEDQKAFYLHADGEYYRKHIIRLEERIKELKFCLDLYLDLDSE